jgi:pimeloyl-ACP methyl ester carboxylesterase
VPQPTPFLIDVPDIVLVDLKARLRNARWPDEGPGAEDWRLGTQLTYMQQLVAYWAEGYDWRERERQLNSFDQFTMDGLGPRLHFIHQQGRGPTPCPLLLSHGWPGSIVEFQQLIPRLTDPAAFDGDAADSFTVIAPSLPGYGLSFRPGQQRLGIIEIADLFADLMSTLGYPRFAAHGHDWGAAITTRLGYAYPDRLLGIHLNLLPLPREPVNAVTAEEEAFNAQLRQWFREETGYSAVMGTRPQTLAYGLTDSPVGLAAWIIEKFQRWSDCNGDLESCIARDTLLDNIMLYWATGAINSSFWPYYARQHGAPLLPAGEKVKVPMGYAEFPKEILSPPRSVAERHYADIRRWTPMVRGGHFAAMEDPDAVAEEIRAFFRPLRPVRG